MVKPIEKFSLILLLEMSLVAILTTRNTNNNQCKNNAHLFSPYKRDYAIGIRFNKAGRKPGFLLGVLKRLQRKNPEIWQFDDCFFHQDNASTQTATSITTLMIRNGIAVLTHPPYSPNMSPGDFFFYSHELRGPQGEAFHPNRGDKEENNRDIKVDEF